MCNLVRQLYPRKTGIFSNDQRYMSVLLIFFLWAEAISLAAFLLLGLDRGYENNLVLWISIFLPRVFGAGYGLVECCYLLFLHSLKQIVFYSGMVIKSKKRKGKP